MASPAYSVVGMGDTFSIVDDCDVEVASVPYEHENGVEATDSPEYRRAVLFAHAPELLAALEVLLEAQVCDDCAICDQARAAIDAARGVSRENPNTTSAAFDAVMGHPKEALSNLLGGRDGND